MKLIASLTSPFARKVRILLAEKGLPYELVVDVPWNAETQVPDFNPLGKVPVLVLDNGETVYDSRVIAAWLESLGGRPLIPADAHERLRVLRMEALADGVSDAAAAAAAAIFVERRRPPAQISEDWINRQQQKVDRGLAALSTLLAEQSWCVGGDFSLADAAVLSCLGYLDFRFPDLDWRERHPNLTALSARLAERDSIRLTLPVA